MLKRGDKVVYISNISALQHGKIGIVKRFIKGLVYVNFEMGEYGCYDSSLKKIGSSVNIKKYYTEVKI